jgi:predicted alpha/beta hydrolase family esterase
MRQTPRLLIMPGLRDSGPAHWQSWLQSLHRGSLRVVQRDWHTPDLDRWALRVASTLERAGPGAPWLVVAHSFGCLALARHIALQGAEGLAGALLVAPADPDKFGVAECLPRQRLPVTTSMVISDTDPWMRAAQARLWAQRWGSHAVNLGDAGHINAEAGFGPLPLAQRWVTAMTQRAARSERWHQADVGGWTFAV